MTAANAAPLPLSFFPLVKFPANDPPATATRDPTPVKLGCLRIAGLIYQSWLIAVGMPIAEHPPHRSRRA